MPIRNKLALLVSLTGVVLGVAAAPSSPPAANAIAGALAAAHDATANLPPGIPGDWWTKVQQDIRESEYNISWQEPTAMSEPSTRPGEALAAGYQAPNRAHGYRSHLTPEAIRVVPRTSGDEGKASSWEWGLKLTGYGETIQPASPAELSVTGNRIEYRRGDLTEWYVNDERGLEQGFTLTAPPQPSVSSQSLITLEMAVTGNLAAKMSQDRKAIEFGTTRGDRVVRYGGLQVQDATGRELPATMEFGDPSLRLVVDAGSATYPITIDPVASNPDWTAESNQANAHYGWDVATAGDVNGDGYDDLIVGAPHYDNGQNNEGRVWVYHGAASGPISPAAFRAEGNQPNAFYGLAAATAGDVNGDGYDDVIVGAPGFDNIQFEEGRVWVYHGSASGLMPLAAFTVESNQSLANLGYAVSTAGDVNGDGYDDVIVGIPWHNGGHADEGRILVYHGSASGLSSPPAFAAESNQAFALYGRAVSTAGDVNGDGYDDVIVGAPEFDNGQTDEGRVWVYHGSASGLISPAAFRAESNQNDANYGWAASTAGDVNGDGYDDVIVGAPLFDNGQTNEGRVWAYHGSASGLISFAAFRAESNQSNANYGRAVSTAGDVDSDGYDDVIVGAPLFDNGQIDEGRVWVYEGSASGISFATLRAESNQSNAKYGFAAATAGDVNGDGYDDVIVGAPYYGNGQTDEGRVDVYHGPL